MAKRKLPFPLVYYPKLAGVFIRGELENKDKEWVLERRKESKKYEKAVQLWNEGRLDPNIELDLSFCKYPPLPHQENCLKLLLALKYSYLGAIIGCVDGDTEFLTPYGWKKIKDYKPGDLVCQWYVDGTTEFIEPLNYIKIPTWYLVGLKTRTLEMVLSPEHRVPYITQRGNIAILPWEEILSHKSFAIPRYFKIPKNVKGLNISDELIRVLIMQSADGNILPVKQGFKIRIRVKKRRKKERVIQLLEHAGIPYVIQATNSKYSKGYLDVVYYPPKEIATKDLSMLYQCNEHQSKVAYEEMLFWDGSTYQSRNGSGAMRTCKCFTGTLSNASVFQYIASVVTGCYCNLHKDKRNYTKESIYSVRVSNIPISKVDFINGNPSVFIYSPPDGFQYCFTTKTGFWLARKNGKIFPTGNSGKTYLSGYVGVCRLLKGKCKNVLIVTPKVAVNQFKKEILKFFDIDPSWLGSKIVVTNYEDLYYHSAPMGTPVERLIKEEYRWFDMVIIDEAHKIKNPRAVSAAILAEICKHAKYRLLMSGTPIRNLPNDLYMQLSLVNPWTFKMSYWHFIKTYFREVQVGKFTKLIVKPQKVHELEFITKKNIIFLSVDREKSIGKPVFNIIKVEPTSKQKSLAVAAANEAIEISNKLVELKNHIMKCQQISSGFLMYEYGRSKKVVDTFRSPKVDKAIDLITEYVKTGEQVVVFAKFHQTINTLSEKLHENSINVVTLTGKISHSATSQVLEKFKAKKIDVIIIQINKGELALNLQTSRRVVFVEYDWSPSVLEQCIGRVYREGQTRTVYVDFVVSKDMVDELILQAALKKDKLSARVLKRKIASFISKLNTKGGKRWKKE